ncbi:NAD(P)-dependent iron-only hydrogenase iron-sulfur protein [Caldicellulosiruptor bescii]|uniref:(2Fe-2S) ferredoxin domain-containing protein n=1 Tax=Caldicellulosiruptor bescii TaxID=31899 RepID=UPI0009A74ABA|nr:(2Fe-2S) ferredoxin domain-containing protein [Caldicellulosiruptor bescii]PBC87811.1 NAD(P)-dependent iron-only hydrogenase iron-sulfur protein [Caldicellulosiruptor bescii]PBC90743.1 NAD(P)-dependent iron-only hydrogenase iron-sulfur protein [Caldicellulosiruptor bescii]PBD03824.1 NAD(P)-dependent iron-only hydrogenase iron-sulfur protein [Caldicellulosiruptor bescii]PBD06541.1 NAD(P)-dependent iron-only hydrogenase iron-sulfur protein [Caldicellulosiruptor bescii]PBD08453.1 NAD(P)-depend
MIKFIQELEEIRKKALEELEFRKQQGEGIRVVVGMATCGIAAGARPVMLKFIEEIQKRNLKNVTVVQTGCIGLCKYEPIVEVYEPNKEKVTYVKMTPEKVTRVVAEHLVNGKPVYEYTIGYEENKEANN